MKKLTLILTTLFMTSSFAALEGNYLLKKNDRVSGPDVCASNLSIEKSGSSYLIQLNSEFSARYGETGYEDQVEIKNINKGSYEVSSKERSHGGTFKSVIEATLKNDVLTLKNQTKYKILGVTQDTTDSVLTISKSGTQLTLKSEIKHDEVFSNSNDYQSVQTCSYQM